MPRKFEFPRHMFPANILSTVPMHDNLASLKYIYLKVSLIQELTKPKIAKLWRSDGNGVLKFG